MVILLYIEGIKYRTCHVTLRYMRKFIGVRFIEINKSLSTTVLMIVKQNGRYMCTTLLQHTGMLLAHVRILRHHLRHLRLRGVQEKQVA